MSSSRGRHESSDITRQIPFEINPAFFPPPTITIPSEDIPPPSDFNYNFEREYEAITRYKEEQDNIEALNGSSPRPTAIDIISKLSYLPISSKPKVQQQPVVIRLQSTASTEQSSISATPPRESPIIPLSSTSSNSYAEDLLPKWNPPDLRLEGLFR